VISTASVVCPYCGREPIQPDSRFCDECGNDLSNLWRTVGPLVRHISDQQTYLDEQTKITLALKDSMARLTERVVELEARLAETVPRTEFEAKQSQPTLSPQAQVAQRKVRSAPEETAAPITKHRVKRLTIVAIIVAVLAVGLVALGVTSLRLAPSASQQSTSCTMTTSAGACQIGKSLYTEKLDVSTGSYSGSYVITIAIAINNTGTDPINITAVHFDSASLQRFPPLGGQVGNGFWWLNSNPIANQAPSQLILEVPAANASSLNGVHSVTLMDSSGTSYAFNVSISLA
jgi:hypothetical protein